MDFTEVGMKVKEIPNTLTYDDAKMWVKSRIISKGRRIIQATLPGAAASASHAATSAAGFDHSAAVGRTPRVSFKEIFIFATNSFLLMA